VPRKAETFQKDLYPPTISSTPALSAEDWYSGQNKDPIMMDMAPGVTGESDNKEFQRNTNRISTILSNNTRPVSQISNGTPASTPAAGGNVLPEGINVDELLEDIKKLKATVRKQGRRIAKLESALEEK
jgi:hypothetical protein